MATPAWLTIDDDDRIWLRLNPDVLKKIERLYEEYYQSASDRRHVLLQSERVHKCFSDVELLQILASSVGLASKRQGAVVFLTFYQEQDFSQDQIASVLKQTPQERDQQQIPILRTLMYLDGDISQKMRRDLVSHPMGDRILQAHCFIVNQVSRRFLTAIRDYLEVKLRPYVIGIISTVTVLSWCNPIQSFGKNIQLPEILISNCLLMSLVIGVIALLAWWGITKLGWSPNIPHSRKEFLLDVGKKALDLLENPVLQILAIAIIVFLVLSWLMIAFQLIPIDAQLSRVIQTIKNYVELSLPVALISLRKLIIGYLGKTLMRNSVVLKFIFGRFIK